MAFMQNWILLGYALPLWYIQTHTYNKLNLQEPLNVLDGIVTFVYIIFFMIEAIADEQQWNFQSNKHKWLKEQKSGVNTTKYTKEEIEDFKRGFLVKGLFRYSRHPNYFGDLFLWWAIYLFTISAQFNSLLEDFKFTSLINYSMFSALLMSYLFQRSVRVTEKISTKKYPEYADYRSKTGRILPSLTPYEPKKAQ